MLTRRPFLKGLLALPFAGMLRPTTVRNSGRPQDDPPIEFEARRCVPDDEFPEFARTVGELIGRLNAEPLYGLGWGEVLFTDCEAHRFHAHRVATLRFRLRPPGAGVPGLYAYGDLRRLFPSA